MIHHANADFWGEYEALPADVRARADKQFALLKDLEDMLSIYARELKELKRPRDIDVDRLWYEAMTTHWTLLRREQGQSITTAQAEI